MKSHEFKNHLEIARGKRECRFLATFYKEGGYFAAEKIEWANFTIRSGEISITSALARGLNPAPHEIISEKQAEKGEAENPKKLFNEIACSNGGKPLVPMK